MDAGLFVMYMCDDTCDQGHPDTIEGNIVENNQILIMRKFNEEDYELVKTYERDFTRAIESRYCTGLLKDELEVIQRIYRETLNRQANLSCGGCVLQMMTSVGRLYFAFKKDYEEQMKIQEQEKQVKERKPRTRRKKNEESFEHQTGEGMPVALQDNN